MLRLLSLFTMATTATLLRSEGYSWTYDGLGAAYINVIDGDHYNDYRLIRFKSLLTEKMYQYVDENLSQFVQILLDEENKQLLIGAKDAMYRLSLDDLGLLQKEMWPVSANNISTCENYRKLYCSNYVVVLKKYGTKLLTCGTHAYIPGCMFRDPTNLTDILGYRSRYGVCPSSPDHMPTSLILSDMRMWTVAAVDRDSHYFLMVMYSTETGMERDPVLSVAQDKFWFNAANFVGSFELGDFIYFFYRETSVECYTCGKNDQGHRIGPLKHFTSFVKARLNCSIPGEVPFYFDQIQSVSLDTVDSVFYAVFTAPPMPGSAVCAYNLSAIHKTFSGEYHFPKDVRCDWVKLWETSSKECDAPLPADMYQHVTRALFKTEQVQPTTLGPLVLCNFHRWRHIEVDKVKTSSGSHTVLFLTTSTGHIKKMMIHPDGMSACLIEVINLVDAGQREAVLAMKISRKNNAIFVVLEGRIFKLPLTRCHRHKVKWICISSQDPYCGWDNEKRMCTTAPENDTGSWEQSIIQCPVLDFPVDGGWSKWTTWSTCPYVMKDVKLQHCACRTRECNNPNQAFNGLPCVGAKAQISNCSSTHGWSRWSQWSPCPPTCDFGRRHRARLCTNTPEVMGGHPCPGVATEEQSCQGACVESILSEVPSLSYNVTVLCAMFILWITKFFVSI